MITSHGIIALVRDKEGKFLLLKEARDLLNGSWAPPHGRCDEIDSSEEHCVVREVKEETNLDVLPLKVIWTQKADTKVKTVSFWNVELIGGSLKVDPEESSEAGWFNVKEALGLKLYPGTKLFFEKVKVEAITV